MEKRNRLSAALGVSFVWFTTQFGGGFASGTQVKSYFINYGIWCIITCVASQAINGFYNGYVAYYCKKHDLYDYRSFCDSIYGRLAPVFSNLYELIYIIVLIVGPAVAFSASGSTFAALTGLPYMVCTAIIGIFIFVVAIYGTAIVRKTASVLSVMIVAGLVAVFVPNIFVEWQAIGANLHTLTANPAPILPALASMLIYSGSQAAPQLAVTTQHACALEDKKDAAFSFFVGFLVNSAMVLIVVFGLLAIIDQPEYADSALPVLVLVQNGVGGKVFTPILSVLIILGGVSTAVNLVSAGCIRVCSALDKNFEPNGKPSKLVAATTFLLCIVGFAVAQFGLLPLVNKGYGLLGYLAIPVIMVPFLFHFLFRKRLDP